MIEYAVGFLGGVILTSLCWALVEVRRRAKKPYRHVIYRKGQPPEVILR